MWYRPTLREVRVTLNSDFRHKDMHQLKPDVCVWGRQARDVTRPESELGLHGTAHASSDIRQVRRQVSAILFLSQMNCVIPDFLPLN